MHLQGGCTKVVQRTGKMGHIQTYVKINNVMIQKASGPFAFFFFCQVGWIAAVFCLQK